MTTSSCQACAYYDEHHSNTGKPTTEEGLCRYNPPVSQPGPDSHGLWPVVTKSDWCGHFSTEASAQHA